MKRNKLRYIYVAGPLTKGNIAENVRQACKVADQLMDYGFVPYVPHLSHFQDMIAQRSYKSWIDHDKRWILRCDALIRLAGKSPGGEIEVKFCKKHGIPVHYVQKWSDLEEFCSKYSPLEGHEV